MEIKEKLLISSSAKKSIKESIELAKELGVGIEISRLPYYKNPTLTEEEVINGLKEDLNGFENHITVHAMFSDLNIGTQDKELKEIVKKRYQQSYNTAKAIGADILLFHTGNKGTLHYGSQETFKENFISFWKEYIKAFESDNITAVIENVFETTPDYCIELMEGVNSPKFKLALDTGHVNLYAQKTKVVDWVKAYGKNLYHLHIHNNYQSNDDHTNLVNGTLNFKEIISEVKKYCENPSFVFEMFTEEDIRKSLIIFKQIYEE